MYFGHGTYFSEQKLNFQNYHYEFISKLIGRNKRCEI